MNEQQKQTGGKVNKPRLIVVVGPTASGKTDLGVRLARRLQGAVVSADSRQVYVGMNIGTAKPTEAWGGSKHTAEVPEVVGNVDHYLFNVAAPNKPLTLVQWQKMAFQVIEKIVVAGKTPLLVGGSMLYIDSVVDNFQIPEVPPDKKMRERLAKSSTGELYKKLITKDPAAAAFIEPHHQQRIIRALEVMAATGQPFSVQRQKQEPHYETVMVGLFPGWDLLENRIFARAATMLDRGLIDEAHRIQQSYGPDLPLLETMNYKQALALARGDISREEATAEMVKVNTQYAHRQMSWWRSRSEITWVSSPQAPEIQNLFS